MNAVAATDCLGLWHRTLLVGPDGATDTGAAVAWLQGISAYVDTRGFAGRLTQHDDRFHWQRDIDLEPPGPHPDVGSMHWDGETLVETGVYENYLEHWIRDEVGRDPVGALFLAAPDGEPAILVRVGERFGWADPTQVVLDTVGGPQWRALAISAEIDDSVQANGVRWAITDNEGTLDL